jgi:hypothetical protein
MASLSPHGPVPWRTAIPKGDGGSGSGIYIVARVEDALMSCDEAPLQFIEPLTPGLAVDLKYEKQRWLPREPVLYIGMTTRPIWKRVGEFYAHKCGRTAPHAGGQILKLLHCELWVYWSPASDPLASAAQVISAFTERTGRPPFANEETKGKAKRVRSQAVLSRQDATVAGTLRL